jgi:hypothetical protein
LEHQVTHRRRIEDVGIEDGAARVHAG